MKNVTTRKKNQRGFTLIELAIIIAVLGILGAVGALKISSMNDDAKRAGAYSAVSNARSALAMAVAKSNGSNVDYTALSANLGGAVTGHDTTNHTFNWDKYKVTYEGTDANITGISTASFIP